MKGKLHRKQQTGFTLVELMVVITVISILAAIAIPSISRYREKATIAVATETGHQILNAFTAFAATSPDNRYPNVDSFEDVVRIVGENGSWLTEKQLAPFRDPETLEINSLEFGIRCTCCPLSCEFYVKLFDVGLDDFSLLIPIRSIDRPPEEMLVLEVSSATGVTVHTGMPEIPSFSPI